MKKETDIIPENISEEEAIQRFYLKSKQTKTRWEVRPEGTPLGIIRHSLRFDDLCWWNGENWVYITTRKNEVDK